MLICQHEYLDRLEKIDRKSFLFIVMTMFLLLVLPAKGAGQNSVVTYPAWYETTTHLNIRTSDNSRCRIIETVAPGTRLKVVGQSRKGWAVLEFNSRTAYCSFKYVRYVEPYSEKPVKKKWGTISKLLDSVKSEVSDLWPKARTVFYILIGLVILIFWQEILQILIFIGIFVGLGALCGSLLGSAEIGAVVGGLFVLLIGVHRLYDMLGNDLSTILGIGYKLISFPFYFLNQLQYFFYGPWRVFFKTDWLDEDIKSFVKWTLEIIKYLLYIATTPLRFVNAVAYNIVVRGITELYDLTYEVIRPSDPNEGGYNFWGWLLWLPWRIIKYPIFHGAATLIEGAIWTVIDIFVPAITMYHGTDLTAGDAITRSAKRNKYLRNSSSWTCGTFTASQSSWGGIGVYFAAKRSVAEAYARDPYRLNDRNPVMIVCRVSLGSTINYALAPFRIYYSAGQNGNPAALNKYADEYGYDTGEWWNKRGGYWEYCMFDWQNKYNHPWRIRPIYVYNFRTQKAQHISGGLRHWFFDKDIFDDLSDTLINWLK